MSQTDIDKMQEYKIKMPVSYRAEELGVAMMNKRKLASLSRRTSFNLNNPNNGGTRNNLDHLQHLQTHSKINEINEI